MSYYGVLLALNTASVVVGMTEGMPWWGWVAAGSWCFSLVGYCAEQETEE
jgi:hypothetical protein